MPLRYICRKCRFPGRVYIPRYQDVRGGVLVLHGSEGGGFGIHDRTAVLLRVTVSQPLHMIGAAHTKDL